MYRSEARTSAAGGSRVESVVDLIGNTPLLKLSEMEKDCSPGVSIYAKAEWFNPGGSIKDRPARRMILEAIRSGELTKDKVIMDSSSGNTAIAYAMIGAALGYEVEIVTPENVNAERKKTIEAYGARITFSSPLEGSDGAIRAAHKLKEENPGKYFMPDQYNNSNNLLAHYETTAPEIWEQTNGTVTHFLAGLGTSGTFMGTGKRLKEYNPQIKTIAIQPAESLHGLEGMKHMPSSIVPGIYNAKAADEVIFVSTEEAYDMMERLMDAEGMFVGHSGGAAVCVTLEYAKKLKEGVLVTILPDSGRRYLSEKLWW
ncbi:MAG: cysteine synthase family protein [Candidatus Dadabacteria bacterium]|nr:cysteine synthase family protein [Candidatus Dadabacteria bacterium]